MSRTNNVVSVLVNGILARFPGPFDVLRELIQNADDAEAANVEVHFQTEEVEGFQSASEFDVGKLNICKWIIKNDGQPFEEKDWKRLGRIDIFIRLYGVAV